MLAKHKQCSVEGDTHEIQCTSCGSEGRDWAGFPCGECKGTTRVFAEAHPECSCDECRTGYWFFPVFESSLAERYKTFVSAMDGSFPRQGTISRRVAKGPEWFDMYKR